MRTRSFFDFNKVLPLSKTINFQNRSPNRFRHVGQIRLTVFCGHGHDVWRSHDGHQVWTCVSGSRGGVCGPVCWADKCVSYRSADLPGRPSHSMLTCYSNFRGQSFTVLDRKPWQPLLSELNWLRLCGFLATKMAAKQRRFGRCIGSTPNRVNYCPCGN